MLNNRNAIPILCFGLTLCMIWSLSGCSLAAGGSYLKKQLICGFEGLMQNFSRTASLSWLHDNKEHVIAEADDNNTFEVTLGPGDNYILLRGEDFLGSLELRAE